MKSCSGRMLAAIVVLLLVVSGASAGRRSASRLDAAQEANAGSTAQTEQAAPPEAFKRVCVRCHTSDRVVDDRRYPSQWNELIEQMVARGATGSDADFLAIIEYLVSEYGRVNVNTASAAELAEVLHLSDEDAAAIVAFRREHGKFADFDALVRMPGAPVEALTTRRDALIF